MLKIKLKPINFKNKKHYKIVLMKQLSKRNGKSILELGFYNPFLKIIKININKLIELLKNGAYPTKSVRYLIYKAFF